MHVNRIEEISLNALPALNTLLYDGWVIRMSGGYLKRANCVNPVYPSSVPLEDKVKYCEELYQNQRLPVIFKLTDRSEAGLDDFLEKKGYQYKDKTSVQILDLADFQPGIPENLRMEFSYSGEWHAALASFNGLSKEQEKISESIIRGIRLPAVFASSIIGGEIVACGYGVLESGYAGIYGIHVRKDHRGKGLGMEIMNGILRAAREKGAENSYLQVMVSNAPAVRLYEKIGYRENYQYWYRMKG